MGSASLGWFLAAAALIGQPGDEQPLLVFVPSGTAPAKIHVDCARRAEQPVSRLLYGKFAEHLGRNIYQGMWSQLVRNAGFEPADLWGGRAKSMVASLAWRYEMPQLVESFAEGLPPCWARFGSEKTVVRPDPDAFNSRACLRIRVAEGAASWSGIRQPLDLPTQRQRAYQWSVHARADRGTKLRVRLYCAADAKLAAETTVALKAGGWRERGGRLQLPERDVPRGGHFLLEIGLEGPATVWLDQCLLFPADHLDGWDVDIVRWVKESRLPILRWPGGNFASGYHWKDGVGPVDQRPVRANRPWKMPEPNHVGTDEFMRFCKLVGCEPMICVNAGDGTPEEAADWVEYCNGSIDTPMGKRRAGNGHPAPYRVRYWEIGNELYGSWQIGHCSADQYAERYRKFAEAMRRRDPTIRLIANGYNLLWNQALVRRCSDILRSVSVHTLIGGGMPRDTAPEKVWWSVAGYPWEYRHRLDALSGQLRQAVPGGKLAITELQVFTNRPDLPNNGGLAEALFWAGIIHTAVRAGDRVELVTHSALVNHGGGLRKARQVVYPNPVYLARKLYSTQPGRWPVPVRLEGPAFSADRLHNLPTVRQSPVLDALALASNSGEQLVLLVINRHAHEPVRADITLAQFTPAGRARWQWITGDGILAANRLERPDAVKLHERTLPVSGARLNVTFPARSVSAITLSRTAGRGGKGR